MMKQLYLFLVIWPLVFFTGHACTAQEWKTIDAEQYQKIMQPMVDFLSADQFHFKLNYNLYQGHASQTLKERMSGFAYKSGSSHYYALPGQNSIQGDGMRVLIDSTDQTMILLEVDKKMDVSGMQATYDEWMASAKRIELQVRNEKQVIRFVFGEYHELEKQEIVLNRNGMVQEIILYYRQEVTDDNAEGQLGQKMKLVYEFVEWTQDAIIPTQFEIKRFLQRNGKSIQPTASFANYTLLDYRIKN
jgi:hypothetical protein